MLEAVYLCKAHSKQGVSEMDGREEHEEALLLMISTVFHNLIRKQTHVSLLIDSISAHQYAIAKDHKCLY